MISSPQREAWFHFIKESRLIFWLAVSTVGLVASLVPTFFSDEVLLSSGILGAGIAGLMSEFTFCLDRREAEYDLQVQKQRYVNLETQVGQIDAIVKKTKIVSINQMFQLGLYLYQLRFLDGDLADQVRAQAEDLGEILRLAAAVREFLSNPYLRPAGGLPPDGQDPFPGMRNAVQLRYAQEARGALSAGSIVSTVMHTSQGFLISKDYQAKVAEVLKDTVGHLYLLPAVLNNMLHAIRELEEGTCDPAAFVGYLHLFMLYLVYRTTGDNPDVVPLFESPVSLARPATAADIKRIWGHVGQPTGGPGPVHPQTPDTAAGGEDASARPGHTWSKTRLERRAQLLIGSWRTAFRLIRAWSLAFWLAVTLAGFTLALIPVAFSVKDFLCSGIIGAGVAGMLSEFTFCFDRSEAASALRDQRKRYNELRRHIDTVESLMRKAEFVQTNQLFKLGSDLTRVSLLEEDQGQSFRIEAEELADFLGLSTVISKFLERLSDSPPGQDPFADLIPAVALRYTREGMEALKWGVMYSMATKIPGYWHDRARRLATAAALKRSIHCLYLPPEVTRNISRVIGELEQETCNPGHFLMYLTLFSYYLDYRMSGEHAWVVPLFESPTPLSEVVAETVKLANQGSQEGQGQAVRQ